jgi:hypothetical protein
MFKAIGLAIGLLIATSAMPVAAQSLRQIDCAAVNKQSDGAYIVLKDISFVDASGNAVDVPKDVVIGPTLSLGNGVSIYDLIEGQCAASAAPPSPAVTAAPPANQAEAPGPTAAPIATPAKLADCGDGTAVYDDKFDDYSGGFGAANGALQIDLSPNRHAFTVLNAKRTQAEGDYCVEVAWPATSGDVNASAGVVVLATDRNNFYLGLISSNGHIGLYRHERGQWTTLPSINDSSALNLEAGAFNAIRIVVEASGELTLYVNGVRTVQAPANIPATPQFGVYVLVNGTQIPPDVPIRFRRYRVAAP